MHMIKAQDFLEGYIGHACRSFISLAPSGSARQNFIGEDGDRRFVVTYNDNLRENEAFFYFSEIFAELKLNTPKILKINSARNLYIQEYLGEHTLSEVIAKDTTEERVKYLVKQSLHHLFNLQSKTQNKIDFSKTYEYEAYDDLPIMHDLYYFKNFMADVLELPYHKSTLLKEFKQLAEQIETLEPRGLMLRDFQARNIMVDANDGVYFIDYQGAMEGPLMYDVVSFLFQAKANFTPQFRTEMLEYYYGLYPNPKTEVDLRNTLQPLMLMRFLQVLGAYGFRGLVQRKEHFIKSIPQGIKNLYELSQTMPEMSKFPELKKLIECLASTEASSKIEQLTKLN